MDWKEIGALVGFAAAWSVVLLFAVKWLLDRYKESQAQQIGLITESNKSLIKTYQTHIDERFSHFETLYKQDAKEWQRVERDLLQFKAVLPEKYVQREDWIRFGSVIDAKQDTLAAKVGEMNAQLQRVLEHTGLQL